MTEPTTPDDLTDLFKLILRDDTPGDPCTWQRTEINWAQAIERARQQPLVPEPRPWLIVHPDDWPIWREWLERDHND